MINTDKFYASIRQSLFASGLKHSQQEGINIILDNVPDGLSVRDLAYVLATAYHETARTMQPVREYGKGKGKSYGKADPLTGQFYYGRGYVQLTWKYNYKKAGDKLGLDLVNKPDLVLDPFISVRILFTGMIEGWFTGKRLANYQGDWKNARRIINGTDKAALIAGYAQHFYNALTALTA